MAGCTLFQHNLNNGSFDNTFFPGLKKKGLIALGEDTDEIHFEIEDLSIFEDIVSLSEMQSLFSTELRNVLSVEGALKSPVSDKGSSDASTFSEEGGTSVTETSSV